MLEKQIEKKCCDLAKKQGYQVRKLQYIGHAGAPDRFFYKSGHSFFVEFKTKKGVVSKIQEYEINLLKNSGLEVYIINDFEDFKKIIK